MLQWISDILCPTNPRRWQLNANIPNHGQPGVVVREPPTAAAQANAHRSMAGANTNTACPR
eukprot:2345236-Lingulodinium_polyedra.AAC.1